MAQVVIRNLDDQAMARLKARARRKGVSLEHELRTILMDTARLDDADFRARAAAFRRKLAGRRHTDSTRLIREDRER
jgi:plasmid stability protein